MLVKNNNYCLTLDDATGSLLSLHNGEKEMLYQQAQPRPLFCAQLLDDAGTASQVHAGQAESVSLRQEETEQAVTVHIAFEKIAHMDLHVWVTVRCPKEESMTYWSYRLQNDTGLRLEWLEFPRVSVPNDFLAAGGESTLFWPMAEGCLVEDAALRNRTGFRYRPIGVQSDGYIGLYPGPVPMQFMAYCSPKGSLYFAAHDPYANLKTVEYDMDDGANAVRLEYRLFPGAVQGAYTLPYEMVLGVFDGDWYAAAERYRSWLESSGAHLPPKISENDQLPEWMERSPVVALYPVRGTKDTGDMTPNQYFPLENSLPYIDQLQQQLQSTIMALPMHWEGTAPWAPPYVWPPFGGEEAFKRFIDKLHEKGNLAGVYCSGIGWTTQSVLVPSYQTKELYEQEHMDEVMCQTPTGDIVQSHIIGYPIRYGYDMCPANEKVGDIVVREVEKIASSGCDYAQFFDQNLGGNSCLCYAKGHGHPAAPGKWQGDSMIHIFQKVEEALRQMGSKMIIGCEEAAAEPFIGYLPFNDLRFNAGFAFSKPVPAYGYVFHEYINNFMGNQNGVANVIDLDKCPDNFLLRIAHSFAAGDMLTLVLAKDGQVHWDWGTSWDAEYPQQQPVKTLVRNLNAWRTGAGKPYLHLGRMLKPYGLVGVGAFDLPLRSGEVHHYPSLFTSRWQAPDGSEAQVIVNYLQTPQQCSVDYAGEGVLFTQPDGTGTALAGGQTIELAPLSAVLVKLN